MGPVNLKLNLDIITEPTDTETDHLGWGILCGTLVQAAKLVDEDVRVDIATRDAAQVNVITNDEYDYNDESEDATNENDLNDNNVIDMIVISIFVDFFNPAPLNLE